MTPPLPAREHAPGENCNDQFSASRNPRPRSQPRAARLLMDVTG